MKRLLGYMLAMVLLLCGPALAEEKGTVLCTDFPCYDIVRAVAGDMVEVSMLIRPGTEVHSYDPSPTDILRIGAADLFVYIGGESDEWVEGILDSFGADMPRCLTMIDHTEQLEEVGEHHGQEEHELDEHIWTSPKNAMRMLRAAEQALCEVFPEHAERFRANADGYHAELARQDAELTELTAGARRSRIVVADRFPFLYMAHDYGIEYDAAFTSCTSETEPSAGVMVRLIDEIVTEGLPCVYTIELSNQRIAQTLSEETGARILQLHSMQTVTQKEFDAGETYISLMDRNIAALREGLE